MAQGIVGHRVTIEDPPIAQMLFSDTRLVLQRQFPQSEEAALAVGAFGRAITGLGVMEPAPEFGFGPGVARKDFPEHPADLGSGEIGQIFFPTPAECSARMLPRARRG